VSQLILPGDHDGGMVKLCSWGAFSPDMEPYVELLPTTGRGTRTRFAMKVAGQLRSKSAAELVRKFAEEVEPRPNSHYFLSTALGAYDYWGANNNGDGFEESELDKEAEDVGHRSFVKHARVYQHHRNKDPNRAMGCIKLSSYNRRMHRVELIEELDNVKAASYIRRWYEVGSLPTSMGCKIAFDVCTICGNKAKTAKTYCEHAKYAMKRVLLDGRKVAVMNPNPRFFDHSHVNVPADKIAGVMEKVASVSFAGVDLPWDAMEKEGALLSAVHGELVFGGQESDVPATPIGTEKTASETREADGEPATVLTDLSDHALEVIKVATDSEPELPLEILEKLAEYPLEESTATLLQLGILPSPREWQFMALCAGGQTKVARELHEARTCFQPDPGLALHDGADPEFSAEWNVRPELVEKLAGFIPTRSFRPEFLSPRLAAASELVKAGAERVVQPWEIRQESPGVAKTMLALAASYGIVRNLAGGDKLLAKGLRELTGTHPAIAGALLSAGIAAGLVTADRIAGRAGETAQGPHGAYTKLSCLLDDEPEDGGEKLASSSAGMSTMQWLGKTPKSVKNVVLPSTAFSAGFLGSSYYRAKQLRGQPTTSVQNVIADHPLGSAVAGVGGYALVRRGLEKARKAL